MWHWILIIAWSLLGYFTWGYFCGELNSYAKESIRYSNRCSVYDEDYFGLILMLILCIMAAPILFPIRYASGHKHWDYYPMLPGQWRRLKMISLLSE